MSERITAAKKRLAEARNTLNQALDLIGERGEEQIYSEGAQWTLRQLAIHLSLSDAGQSQMLYHYAEGKDYIPADYDIERYNKRSVEKKAEMSLHEASVALEQSRAELLRWLDGLSDEAVLDKKGRHANMQILSLSEIIEVMAKHEEAHAKDIMAMLEPS
jgi:hypothetical protein